MSPHPVWMPVVVLLVVLDLRGLLVDGSLGLILSSEGKPASSVSAEQGVQRIREQVGRQQASESQRLSVRHLVTRKNVELCK